MFIAMDSRFAEKHYQKSYVVVSDIHIRRNVKNKRIAFFSFFDVLSMRINDMAELPPYNCTRGLGRHITQYVTKEISTVQLWAITFAKSLSYSYSYSYSSSVLTILKSKTKESKAFHKKSIFLLLLSQYVYSTYTQHSHDAFPDDEFT